MKLTKHISKQGWLKLGFFLVLLAAAWVYDSYHLGNTVQMGQPGNSTEEDASVSGHFFCTLQGPVSLKAPVEKTLLKKSLQEKLSRFLMVQLKARMTFLLKAEVKEQPHSFLSFRNLNPLRYYHSGSPDDQPPLS